MGSFPLLLDSHRKRPPLITFGFITNSGFTGVQQALGHGVPLIVAGSTEEKPLVAARVAWSGAGLDLKTGGPSAEQVRNAVRTILADPAYHHRSKELKVHFSHYTARATTAKIAEATLSASAC
jgi:UDP:flavonoid glycosyltransferase YjiC (YdhE family)